MIATELAQALDELDRPERFLPVLVPIGPALVDGWYEIVDFTLDEDRIVLRLERLGG